MKKKLLSRLLLVGLLSSSSIIAYSQSVDEKEFKEIKENVEKNTSNIKKSQKLKVSGYIQTQAEFSQIQGSTKTGANSGKYSSDIDGKDAEYFTRYGIRRGRIKFEYSQGIGKAVFQMDLTEKGIGFKDAYYQVTDPWAKVVSLKAGLFDRSFGDEISYSSSKRESPERTLMYQKLFPDERDLGALLTISAPKGHALEGLKLNAGLYSGNGIRVDDNGKMDFIGHLKYDKTMDDISFGIGASYYNGTTNNADTLFYSVENALWTAKKVEANQLNKREYIGFDAQFTAETFMGITNIRAEYVFGTQPSLSSDFGSPKSNTYNPASAFNYNRHFSGYHAYLVQDIYHTPLALVLKYAYLDANNELKGDEIKNKTDLSNTAMGFGLLWKIKPELRLQAYYEANSNELSKNVSGYDTDRKDDIFTLRLQYKF